MYLFYLSSRRATPRIAAIWLVFSLLALSSCSNIPMSTPTDTPIPTNTPPLLTSSPTSTLLPLPTDTPAISTMVPTATVGFHDGSGSWSIEPPMQFARAAHAVVSTGTTIYALAGTGEGGPVLEVERFEGTEWVVETTLPGDGLNAPAAVFLNEHIYLIGGFNTTTNIPSDQVLVYDLAGQTWQEAAPLPAPRGGHAAVMLDGKIHVFGGGNSQSTIADHSVYDPETNAWADLSPVPRAEGSPAAVVFSGRIYVIGGRSGFSDFGDVYIYDPQTDTWETGPSIEPRGTAGAVEYCGTIYLFGGESQAKRENLSSALRLNLDQGVWEEVHPMPTARNFARAVLLEDSVVVVGGSLTAGASHSSTGSTVVERYQSDCTE